MQLSCRSLLLAMVITYFSADRIVDATEESLIDKIKNNAKSLSDSILSSKAHLAVKSWIKGKSQETIVDATEESLIEKIKNNAKSLSDSIRSSKAHLAVQSWIKETIVDATEESLIEKIKNNAKSLSDSILSSKVHFAVKSWIKDATKENLIKKIKKHAMSVSDVILSSKARLDVKSWIKGEISGKQCLYYVIETTFIEGATAIGGAIGNYIASTYLGADWSDTGRSAGRWLAKTPLEFILNFLKQNLFGRNDEALSHPYRILRVEKTASMEEISTAYQKLARKYNRKISSGSKEKFFILQFTLAVTKNPKAKTLFN